jgi:hypothetical protein
LFLDIVFARAKQRNGLEHKCNSNVAISAVFLNSPLPVDIPLDTPLRYTETTFRPREHRNPVRETADDAEMKQNTVRK